MQRHKQNPTHCRMHPVQVLILSHHLQTLYLSLPFPSFLPSFLSLSLLANSVLQQHMISSRKTRYEVCAFLSLLSHCCCPAFTFSTALDRTWRQIDRQWRSVQLPPCLMHTQFCRRYNDSHVTLLHAQQYPPLLVPNTFSA